MKASKKVKKYSHKLVLDAEKIKILKKLQSKAKELFNDSSSQNDKYCDFLGLNTYTFSKESQIDLMIEAILKSEKIYKYTYKNGTRIAKGKYVVDKNGKQKFQPLFDLAYLSVEPWPLKFSKTYAKLMIGAISTGDPVIQNLRAILFNWILKHRVEKSEFLKFYKLFQGTLKKDDFPQDAKKLIFSEDDLGKEKLDWLTDKIYNLTVANEKPMRIDCEQKLISDAYLATYSRFCEDYVKGSTLDNLVAGNSFSDLEKSIEKISKLFKEFLKSKIKFLPTQESRKAYMTNTVSLNRKYKQLIELTKKNSDEFFKVMIERYGEKIKQKSADKKIKFDDLKIRFKENFDVLGYLLWEFLTKAWMKWELLHYFDENMFMIYSLCESYLPSEMLYAKAQTIKKYILDKITLDNHKPHGVHLISPIDETTDPKVYSGLNLD